MSAPGENMPPDHYAVLGIGRTASEEDLRKAYSAASLELRTARALDPQGDASQIYDLKAKQLTSAYETLSEPSSRAAYNAVLDRAEQTALGGAAPAAAFNSQSTPHSGSKPWLGKAKLGLAVAAFALLADQGYSLWKKYQPPSNVDLSTKASFFVGRLAEDMRDVNRSQQIQQNLKVSPADAALILGAFSGETQTGKAKGWSNRKLIGQYIDKGVTAHVLQKLSDGRLVDIAVDPEHVKIDYVKNKDLPPAPEGAKSIEFNHSDRTKAALAKDMAAANLEDWKKRNPLPDPNNKPKMITPRP